MSNDEDLTAEDLNDLRQLAMNPPLLAELKKRFGDPMAALDKAIELMVHTCDELPAEFRAKLLASLLMRFDSVTGERL